ncbi:MAG: hypothetical protein M2R45_02135 [Verrucomicrobia subdivision 3 bacterium]|nr:hypothetical protein [Limisphaerales bacterium]MCS1413712.1 hypothetical protein [Limisphaerales bacterium]
MGLVSDAVRYVERARALDFFGFLGVGLVDCK